MRRNVPLRYLQFLHNILNHLSVLVFIVTGVPERVLFLGCVPGSSGAGSVGVLTCHHGPGGAHEPPPTDTTADSVKEEV